MTNSDSGSEAEISGETPPAEIVTRFLSALEKRDLEAASAHLAADAVMVFPGGATFGTLEELVDWAADRSQRVTKRIGRIDVADAADGDIVICQGTLTGSWPDGTPFEGIRFCDWFLIRGGRIIRQEVWNDLAEAKSQSA